MERAFIVIAPVCIPIFAPAGSPSPATSYATRRPVVYPSSATEQGPRIIRHNAKYTLDKTYLYLAERLDAQIQPQTKARDLRPLPADELDGARHVALARRSTAWVGWLGTPERSASSSCVRAMMYYCESLQPRATYVRTMRIGYVNLTLM